MTLTARPVFAALDGHNGRSCAPEGAFFGNVVAGAAGAQGVRISPASRGDLVQEAGIASLAVRLGSLVLGGEDEAAARTRQSVEEGGRCRTRSFSHLLPRG